MFIKMILEKESGKKSLPYEWFKDNAHLIGKTLNCPVDYLSVIDAIK